nr:MAG TPA: hypothetical protein [Bacteriophage sp.]
MSRLKRHRKKLLDLFFFCFGNGCLNGHDFPPEKLYDVHWTLPFPS